VVERQEIYVVKVVQSRVARGPKEATNMVPLSLAVTDLSDNKKRTEYQKG